MDAKGHLLVNRLYTTTLDSEGDLMEKSTMFLKLFQRIIPEQEVKPFILNANHVDTAQKVIVYQLLLFFSQASFGA